MLRTISTAYTKVSARHHRVIVTYKIDERAGGLVNQMLCHIGAFLLTLSLRAELVLPQALSRSTFDTAWWQQEWQERPIDTLLDVDRIIRHWRQRGVCIHKVYQCIVSDCHASMQFRRAVQEGCLRGFHSDICSPLRSLCIVQ